jgi:hypothetical protein
MAPKGCYPPVLLDSGHKCYHESSCTIRAIHFQDFTDTEISGQSTRDYVDLRIHNWILGMGIPLLDMHPYANQ